MVALLRSAHHPPFLLHIVFPFRRSVPPSTTVAEGTMNRLRQRPVDALRCPANAIS